MANFKDFPLHDSIQKALDTLGFSQPTEIQEKTLSALLSTQESNDFHGQAQTGTGKTLAFGIPLIQTIDSQVRAPQALIVAPTRELVLQICDSLKSVAQFIPITIESIYGGMSIERQIFALKRGVHIVVGTPGRLNDHLRRKTLSLKSLRTLVLDEADIMLDMGFKEEVDEILEYAPENRQIWLFSATVKPGIENIKRDHMRNPILVRIGEKQGTASNTKQSYCSVPRKYKLEALTRFIDSDPEFYGMVFCKTKLQTSEVAEELAKRNYRVNALHGDMDQPLRNKVIKGFKERSFNILIATDVAARGIDVNDLTHVINFCLPEDQESYVHRIGRTGRAGKEGIAITFIERSEMRRLMQLMHRFKTNIKPLDVPSNDAIAQIRLDQALKTLDTMCAKQPARGKLADALHAALVKRSPQELVNGLAHLMQDTLLKGCQEQAEISFIPASEVATMDPSDQQEIMFHVGSEDGITKGDIMHYLTRSNVINGRDIGRIRVIKKRTFVMVPAKVSTALLNSLKNMSIHGRKVRVTYA
ncbi:MAG: DEAD/DEAH box helicase [Candidatus Babeliales bacterium]